MKIRTYASFALAALMISPMAGYAKDSDFNGKWNIRVKTGRGRVWWLDVQGIGTSTPKGYFVGAPGGDLDVVPSMNVQDKQLMWSFEKRGWGPNNTRPMIRQMYSARLEKGRLEGLMKEFVNGAEQPPLYFTGIRAPKINDKDDGSWRPEETVKLFNGADTSGWYLLRADAPGWKVEEGLLKNDRGASDLVSAAKFWNFSLKAEYRYAKGSNSGIALRGRYEVQIYDDHGKPADTHGHGALYSRILPAENASRPAGEWQELEVRLVGREISVKLNGKDIIVKQDAVGPTAMTIDPEENQPGPIVLQGDHGPIEFRKVEITPLKH
jgi:hypothetical protein